MARHTDRFEFSNVSRFSTGAKVNSPSLVSLAQQPNTPFANLSTPYPVREPSTAARCTSCREDQVGLGGLEDPLIVGHDIGGMVAYAYGRLYPEEVSGVAVLDVPIPGLSPWEFVANSPEAWHFDFHAQRGLTETLVSG